MAVRTPSEDEPCVDLEIRIFPRNERVGSYPVEITLGGQQEFPRGHLTADILPWIPTADLTADGQRLFETLFADSALRSAWAEARGQTPQRRIRLRIDPAAAELHAVPWELLQEGPAMLSAQTDTPLSRYLPIALPWGGPVEERPIRVLVVIPDPTDIEDKYGLPRADVALERHVLESAFEAVDSNDLQVDFLDAPVTLVRLEEQLGEGYHILHYLGHGAFSQKRGRAALYMQDDEGLARLVYENELSSMLARRGVRPRLVFLAACESAARSPEDAFLGMAPKLVSVGVPAVVAMRELVTVDSVLKFSQTFYRRLLEHGQVDLAVNEARSTLLTARRPDAAVPVLFMRLKSGQLWGSEADARGKILGAQKPRMFWDSLLESIELHECTPIIGPRVHGRWLPTPQEIAMYLAEEYTYPFAGKDDLAQVTQYLVTSATGRKEYSVRRRFLQALRKGFIDHLRVALRPQERKGRYATLTELVRAVGWSNLVENDPNEIHQVLASLELPLYLTTNYDSFMVEALTAEKKTPHREICRWNDELDELPSLLEGDENYEPTSENPLVYHLLGSDEEASSLVLTEDHYFSFLVRVPAEQRIPNALRDALAMNTLVFIGYGLYDWEFRVVLHGLIATLQPPFEIEHVAVQLELAEAGEADIAKVQTFLEEYFQAANIAVYWGSATQFVAELREYWEAGRQ